MHKILLIICITGLLTACVSDHFGRRDAGTVIGGVAGGVLGHELTGGSLLGTVGGAAGGAYLGNQLAR